MLGSRGRAQDPWLILLLLLHLLVGVIAVGRSGSTDDSDVLRFAELASSNGAPWRDFEVEYAPGEALLILALPDGVGPTAAAVALLALVADLSIALVLLRRWSRRTAVAYLAVMLPVLTFAFARLDLIVVALTVAAAATIAGRRDTIGGAILGLAVVTKIWPVVVAPMLVRGRRAAAWAFLVTVAVVGAAWLVWGGPSAIEQVATFRGARGWSVESMVGSLVWIVTGGPVTIEAGAPRTGEAWLGWKLLLLAAFVLAWWWIARRSRAWAGDPLGTPSLAALGALLIAAPLFSLQYAMWLAPSVAVAWTEPRSRRVAIPGAVAIALTGLEYVVLQVDGGGVVTRATVLARNLAVIWMTVAGVRALSREA